MQAAVGVFFPEFSIQDDGLVDVNPGSPFRHVIQDTVDHQQTDTGRETEESQDISQKTRGQEQGPGYQQNNPGYQVCCWDLSLLQFLLYP